MPGVSTVVLGARDREEIGEGIETADLGPHDADLVARIDAGPPRAYTPTRPDG